MAAGLVLGLPGRVLTPRLLLNPSPEQPTFEKVQGWVHRKLRLAEGEGFDAAFACDLLDGSGEREVMLDDGESSRAFVFYPSLPRV